MTELRLLEQAVEHLEEAEYLTRWVEVEYGGGNTGDALTYTAIQGRISSNIIDILRIYDNIKKQGGINGQNK